MPTRPRTARLRIATRSALACLVAVASVLGTTVLATVLLTSPAHACSCAAEVPAADLIGAREIAFVGTAAPGREIEPGLLEYEVAVEVALKGRVPQVVRVQSAVDGASCGIAVPTGRPMGFVPSEISPLGRRDGWSVDLCSGLVPPAELVTAVDTELPAPTGVGPVSALLIARAGPAEAVAVGADGRPVGWVDVPGTGFVDVLGAATCPGGAIGTVLVARYDGAGSPASTAIHRIDLATLEVDAAPLAEADPVPFGPWSVGGSACVADDGTTLTLVDDDGDGVPDALDRIGPPDSAEGAPDTFDDLGEGPSAIDGTRLVQVVDDADGQVVQLRELTSTASPIELFTLDGAAPVAEVDVFRDEVYLRSPAADGSTTVERRALDGAVTGSWRVVGLDVRKMSVGGAGVLVWDGTTGRQRLLPVDGSPIDLDGDFGGTPLGDGVLTWGFDGTAQYVLADGSPDPSWSFLGVGGIRFAVPMQATIDVDPSSLAAGPLAIVDVPGTIVDPEPTETSTTETATTGTSTTGTATTDEGAAVATTADEPTTGAAGGRERSRSPFATVIVVLLSIAALGAIAAVAVSVARTRRRGQVGG